MLSRSTKVAIDPSVRAELNETLARCRVLFLGPLWRTRERTDWVGACLYPMYATRPPAVEEMRGLAALAFGGWCWRDVERGDRAPVERAVRDAYAAAAADDSIPATLTPSWASWNFLADGGRPGLGSPGARKGDRLAFLAAAAEKFYETYGPAGRVEREAGYAAFHHGVVLNDVERLVLGRAALVT